MIFIIHGDDFLSSRNYLNSLSKKFIRLDASELDIAVLIQETEGSSLFDTDRSILIENLYSKKAVKDFESLKEAISSSTIDIYIYESRQITAKNVSSFPKSKVEIFKYPQNLFAFLDSIYPGNKQSIKLFHEALNYTNEQILFFMMIRQVRIMLSVIFDASIEESQRLAPWQRSKFRSQALRFGKENLVALYRKMFRIDYDTKTGQSPLPLVPAIDMLLVSL